MPFFETGAFWANHTQPEWTPGQDCVMLEANQYKEVLPMKKPTSLADAAAIAQFRLAIIAPVIHNLYPDATRNAYYERVTEKPFTLPDGRTVQYCPNTISGWVSKY